MHTMFSIAIADVSKACSEPKLWHCASGISGMNHSHLLAYVVPSAAHKVIGSDGYPSGAG